jgi:tetratricopeptide (TPR) repeat protein
MLAYWPAIHGGFLFDDDAMVTGSALVKASDGLRRMWFTTEAIDYWPLTNSSLWLEWRLWGAAPTGYHVTNVLLHIASALVLWSILRRLRFPAPWLGAMVFALHPVNVQSVAWIAQRKNTLALFCFLLATAAFLNDQRSGSIQPADVRSVQRKGGRQPARMEAAESGRSGAFYWLSLVAFTLAMLSKGSVAVFPGVLLLLIWWERGRLTRKDVLRVAPFLAVAVGLTLVNVWFQMRMPGGSRDVTILQRVLGAAGVVWFYLAKALVPARLTFMYPQWDIDTGSPLWWMPLLCACGVTAWLVWKRDRPIIRAALFGWAFFCLALIPVMGLTDVYFMKYSLVADHYEYIAVVAVAAAVGCGVLGWWGPRVLGAWGVRIIAAAVLIFCWSLTWNQAHLYAGAETLYRATLERNPSAWPIRNNLGALLLARDANEEAAAQLERALRGHPEFVQAHNNYCNALARVGRLDEALTECATALRLDPDRAVSYISLGMALASSGRLPEARRAFETALKLRPDSVEAHSYLADLLLADGEAGEAARHYREVLRERPASGSARAGLGRALDDLGDIRGAEAALREAIQYAPQLADPYRRLADVLVEQGRMDEAIDAYRKALSRDDKSAETQNNLAVALARVGRTAEAIEHFRTAIDLDPTLTDARSNLAKLERR